MDEVAAVVQHSDKPNIKVKTFFHSPSKMANDPDQLSVSIMWPIQDIQPKEGYFRDFLDGFTEQKFRSTRLHSWFDLSSQESYFEQQLSVLRKTQPKNNITTEHAAIEEGATAKPVIDTQDGETIKVFTDEKSAMATLKDPRFEFVDQP